MSAVRKASGIEMRRLAESSRVRSNLNQARGLVDCDNERVGFSPPLRRSRLLRVLNQRNQMPRQPTHPLAPHRVPLVSHRRASNLIFFKRFFQFFHVCEETNVGCEFVGRDAECAEGRENVEVDVAGVGLAGYLEGGGERGERGDEFVEFFALPTNEAGKTYRKGSRAKGEKSGPRSGLAALDLARTLS